MSILEAKALSKTWVQNTWFRRGRASIRALEPLSFCLEQGQALGIAGGSGSGKSTLAQILAGAVLPSSGQLLSHGQDVLQLGYRQRCFFAQLIWQDPSLVLPQHRTVGELWEEVLQHVVKVNAADVGSKLLALSEQLHLGPLILKRLVKELSGGQKQRVAIGRALCVGAKVLVCDEPVSALDRVAQAEVLELVDRLKCELGLAIVLISHDLSVLRDHCDEIIVLHEGKAVERGPTVDVLNKPQHAYTKALLAAVPSIYQKPS